MRAAGIGGAWMGGALVATLVPLLLAANLPRPGALELGLRLGDLAGGDTQTGRFAPLDPRIVTDVLGPGALERLFGPPVREVGEKAPGPARARDTQRRGDGRGEPEGSPAPVPLLDGPDLRIGMAADRTQARRGEIVTYTITVTNVGRGEANGVSVTSHVPDHTSLVAGGECGGETAKVEENPNVTGGYSVCTEFPGPPAPGEHGYSDQGRRFGPGQSQTLRFKVSVDPDTPEGTVIRNHAHVRGADFAHRTSSEVSTVVRLS